jgi:hypothetical protein
MNHLKHLGIFKLGIVLVVVFLFSRCMHDEYEFDKLSDEMEINMGLLTPLAYGSLSLNDIISEFDSTSYISTYEEGLLFITYEDSLLSFIAEDLLEVPDQDFFEYFIESDIDVPAYIDWGDTVIIERRENFSFTFSNNEKLDSIYIESANLNIDVNSTFKHTGKVILSSQFIRNNQGEPFTDTIPISDPSGTFAVSKIIPLDNYVIELNDTTASDTTYLPFDFKLILYNSGNGIDSGDQVEIASTLTDLTFSAIFGYIGNYDLITEVGEIDLGFFETLTDGYIEFKNPQINFNISNSYGLPAEIDIQRLTGFDSEGDSVNLTFDPVVNPFRYAYPKLDEFGQTKDTVISINGNNSSISEFLAFMPNRLEYNMLATSNPDGPDENYNFVSKDSRIDVGLEFILPLWFKANNIALQDTIDMDLSDINEDAEMVEKLNIILQVFNGLPLDIDFQIYFLDELYAPVDTLFDAGSQPIIAAGQIDSDNKVAYPTKKISVIEYLKPDIDNLENVKYAAIKAVLKTTGFEDDIAVKFYDYYTVDFNLSIDIEATINTNDL